MDRFYQNRSDPCPVCPPDIRENLITDGDRVLPVRAHHLHGLIVALWRRLGRKIHVLLVHFLRKFLHTGLGVVGDKNSLHADFMEMPEQRSRAVVRRRPVRHQCVVHIITDSADAFGIQAVIIDDISGRKDFARIQISHIQ